MAAVIYRFYHDQLPDDAWRDFYNMAEAAVRAYAPILFYPKVLSRTAKDYYRVLNYVYNDHPELFYFNYYGCKYSIGVSSVRIDLCYSLTAASMQQKSLAVNRAVDRILAECFPEGISKTSELRREKKIFDWLTYNVTYDHDSLKTLGARMDILGDAWTAYGALVLRKAVCQGISCAFKLLCDRVNIPSLVVIGNAGGPHAWNIVRVDGRFYQVDCTWTLKHGIDLSNPFKRYQYLNITDEIIRQDHTPNDNFLPKCISLRSNPYMIKGLCCKTLAELTDLAIKHALNGEDRFAFLCLAGFPAAHEQRAIAEKIAGKVGGTVRFYADKNKYFMGFDIERRR